LRLGFVIPIVRPAVSGAPGLSAFCRGLEDLGYDTLWVGDRLVTPVDVDSSCLAHGPQMTRSLDPVLLWTVAAAATSRMRLNASTLSTFYYEPPHLARLLTTLDVLSDGRLGVGVGLGWMKQEYDIARNADWHRRGEMLDDMLAFLHAWWTTNPVSWDSEFFTLPPVHADLRPVQAGGPHIWIGGGSEAAMRRVGRSGVGWLGFDGLPAAASIQHGEGAPEQLRAVRVARGRRRVEAGDQLVHLLVVALDLQRERVALPAARRRGRWRPPDLRYRSTDRSRTTLGYFRYSHRLLMAAPATSGEPAGGMPEAAFRRSDRRGDSTGCRRWPHVSVAAPERPRVPARSRSMGRLDVSARLEAERAEAADRIAALERQVGWLAEQQALDTHDDEHDPEGVTIAAHRAQLLGLLAGARRDLAASERAVDRLEVGVYGRCLRCGRDIGEARLEALPATEICIACAERRRSHFR
jgi:alkanesulfonate monooxygenase SsuD/methylene tetrahydromethanopterin reductase-like flavin-dependent oxidoreductase (luciferase family)/RNA polymerase-binding transcription factor DksA